MLERYSSEARAAPCADTISPPEQELEAAGVRPRRSPLEQWHRAWRRARAGWHRARRRRLRGARSWTQSHLARLQLRSLATMAKLWGALKLVRQAGLSLTTTLVIVAIAVWASHSKAYSLAVPVRDVFLAEGTVFATVLTLAFTLAMITIQRAAQDFSTGVLVTYARDVRVQVVFLILASLTVLSFSIAASTDATAPALSGLGALAVLLVAVALDTLRWLYRRVAVALQPEEAIAEMLRYASRDIARREYLARLVQKAYLGRPGDGPRARVAAAAAFARVPGYRQAIRHWSENLAEDALRALARRQSSIAGMAVTAIGELGIKAIDARARDTLFAVDPRELIVTTSDLQGILGPLSELLAEIGRKSLESKDSQTAIAVARTFVAVAKRTSTVKGEREVGEGSLVVPQILMFKGLVEDGIKFNDGELPFQALQILDGASSELAPRVSPYGFVRLSSGLITAVAVYHIARQEQGIAGTVTGFLLHLAGICLVDGGEEHVRQVEPLLKAAVPIYRVAAAAPNPDPLHGPLDGMFRVQQMWGVICEALYQRAIADNGAEFRTWAHRVTALAEAFSALVRDLFAHQAGRDRVLVVGIKQAAQPILRTLAFLALRDGIDLRGRTELLDSFAEVGASLVRFTSHPDASTWMSVDDIADLLAIESFPLVGPDTFDAVDVTVDSLLGIAEAAVQAGKLREASHVLVHLWMLEQIAAHRQLEDLEGWLDGKREPWIARLPDDVREQVQGLLEEAIADAQSKLAGRAVPRLSDHAIGAMAAIMGRRLRGMFED